MLTKFVVQNFLSFYEETELNMLTDDVDQMPDHVYRSRNLGILKSAVIYGASGAGKSNLIFAMTALRDIVTLGSMSFSTTASSFRMKDMAAEPSKLAAEFIDKGVRYAYGILFIEGKIIKEWLYILKSGKRKDELIFERKTIDGSCRIQMSPRYTRTKRNRLLIEVVKEDLLQDDMPFLYLATDRDFDAIDKAADWFENGLQILAPNTKFTVLKYAVFSNKHFRRYMNDIISQLVTGIHEIDILNLDFDRYFGEDNRAEKERVLAVIRNGEGEEVGERKNALAVMEFGKPVVKKLVLYQKNEKGEQVRFEWEEMSDGTRRLIEFLPLLFLLEFHPVTVIVDEIDSRFYPAILKEFITFFQRNRTKRGQLIFATREPDLVDMDLFRPDEIWLTEKDALGATQLYPLSDINVRTDKDILEGYLPGKFGAIPFPGNLANLKWDAFVKEHR